MKRKASTTLAIFIALATVTSASAKGCHVGAGHPLKTISAAAELA